MPTLLFPLLALLPSAEVPVAVEFRRFPPASVVRSVLACSEAHEAWIRARLEWDTRNALLLRWGLERTRKAQDPWRSLMWAQGALAREPDDTAYLRYQLDALRKQLGRSAYQAGTLPDPLPLLPWFDSAD